MDSNQTVNLPPFPPRIGRYQITAELGRGAMGIVYRGFDPNIGRVVAIKTVQLGGGDDSDELLMRFRREAQAAGQLSHPHIVTIHDAGEDQGVFYIAMEFVEGDTLHKVISGGALTVEQATTIIEEVGSALDHAHRREVVHRDIKPANIMITSSGAKIMDFGVAKVASSTATATGMVIGTPSYMSPEGVKGMPVDGRADIFSLGVVLYEMLTNKRPFVGDSIPSVIYKIIGAHPDAPTAVNPNLHPGLNVVVLRALAKEPATRYQTCAEMLRDLKNYHLLETSSLDATIATAKPITPTVLRTLAPPMVSGTVAIDVPTLVVPGPRAPARAAAAPPEPRPTAPSPVSSSMLAKVAAAIVLLAVLAGGGLLWRNRQQQTRRDAEAKRVSELAAAQSQAQLAQAKPSLSDPASDAPAATPGAATPVPGPAAALETPPAAAPVEREVMVKSNIAGATIRVDGKSRAGWVTPRRVKLPFGAHRIEVSKDGYKSAMQNPKVTEQGPKELAFTLAAVTREIEIVTTPPGAQVNVDGSDQDALTPGRYSLPYGQHTIQVRKPGFRAESRTLQVDASTAGLAVTLEKEGRANKAANASVAKDPGRAVAGVRGGARGEGRVRVQTIPRGAEIHVDGAATDYKSPVNFLLPAGPHKITVTHKGVPPVTRNVEVKAGEMVDLQIDMAISLRRP